MLSQNTKASTFGVAWFRGLCRRAVAAAFAAAVLVLGATPALAKYASLVMDAETGRVIHKINADTRNYPASLTKMMTIYLVFDTLKNDLWTLNTRLRVSARAARQPASRLGLRRGQRISVEDAILALVTKSANDVATLVAENMSGSERGFALKMTATARRLGMSRTTFRNASGLPHRSQLSTARDMGILARALLRDFPVYFRYFSTDRFTYRGTTHRNHNKLLKTYDGVDGVKTGYIRTSGFNLVATAHRNGRRVIGVIFGGNSPNSRNAQMTRLLNLGFKVLNQKPVRVAAFGKAKTRIAKAKPRPMPVVRAKPKTVLPKNRGWGVQVGAFARYAQAFEAARSSVKAVPALLNHGRIKVVPLRKRNGKTLQRARIYGISKKQAYRACRTLKKRKKDCMELRMPDGYQVAANVR